MPKRLFFILAWVFTIPFASFYAFSQKSYVIASRANEQYVLAIPNSRYDNNTQPILWEYHSSYKDQKFCIYEVSPGYVQIHPEENTQQVIAVPASNVFDGNPVILWNNNYGNEQMWELCHLQGLIYVFRSKLNRDYVLAASGNVGNNSGIVIQKYTGAENQQWVMIRTGNEFYELFKIAYDKD